jgi:hypothetical protein
MSSVCQRQLTAATAAALLGLPVAAAVAQQSGPEDSLREKLVLSEAAIKGLTESLAVANGETEVFRRRTSDLNDRIEALGLSGKDDDAVRTRLLAAVRDLRLLQKENDEVRERLTALTESVMTLLKTSEGIDAKARLRVEECLRAANALMGRSGQKAQGNQAGLTGGRVVDVKPALALVVSDLGSRQGVKTGMPFQVWRGDRQIASVRVVDVRDSVSGAIVQNTSTPADNVRPGDLIRIDTTR